MGSLHTAMKSSPSLATTRENQLIAMKTQRSQKQISKMFSKEKFHMERVMCTKWGFPHDLETCIGPGHLPGQLHSLRRWNDECPHIIVWRGSCR